MEQKELDDLYDAFLKLETKEECSLFLDDLLTKKELESIVQRWQAAKLLLEGKTYEEVINTVNISSATLSRVSRCVKYGNGYKKIGEKKE